MNIAIVGTGYVGLVTGACFAEMGVQVACVDIDEAKIEQLKKGVMPIFEPGLEEMVVRNMKANRLHFTTSLLSVLDNVEVVFSAVGTPPGEDGSADMRYVFEVAQTIGKHLSHYILVVTKSTVPVGTAQKVKSIIQEELDKRGLKIPFDVASNPEFLKEGDAISDFMSPDRVVVGIESDQAQKLMTQLYRPFLLNNFRVIFMDIPSAELTKYAANAMLATRISFMNEIANLCEKVGADINMVRKGISTDSRIGTKFLYSGIGYGGSCFPKDVRALIQTAHKQGCSMDILQSVDDVNNRQKSILFDKFTALFDQDKLSEKIVAMWGLSFKPNTDDVREAPALVLIRKLVEAGCHVKVFDPIAIEKAQLSINRELNDDQQQLVYFSTDIYDTVNDADALMLVTEWKEFRMPNWQIIKKLMKQAVILDGRNIYDKKEIIDLGFSYEGIGV
jgi:UDPglucose 6-dehydrogenase